LTEKRESSKPKSGRDYLPKKKGSMSNVNPVRLQEKMFKLSATKKQELEGSNEKGRANPRRKRGADHSKRAGQTHTESLDKNENQGGETSSGGGSGVAFKRGRFMKET